MLIRETESSDLDALVALEQACFDSPWSEKAIASELSKETTEGWLLSDSNRAVGFILFQHILDECELLRVAVSPSFRRRGAAESLIRHGLDHLIDAGAETCFLEVHGDNGSAVGLYKKLGFKVSGERKSYYSDGGDAQIMSANLTERCPPPRST